MTESAYAWFQEDCRIFWEPIRRTARSFWFRPWLRTPTESTIYFIQQRLVEMEIEMIEHHITSKKNGYYPDPSAVSYYEGKKIAFYEMIKYLRKQ